MAKKKPVKKRRKPLTPKEKIAKQIKLIREQVDKLGSGRDTLRYMLQDLEELCDDWEEAEIDAFDGISSLENALEKMSEKV